MPEKEHLGCGGRIVYAEMENGGVGYLCLKCGQEFPKRKRRRKMSWDEKISGKISFEKEGMEVVGKVTDIKSTDLGVNSYSLTDEDGDLVSFLGTTVLDRLLSTELNSLVKIIYTGEVRTGRGFKVKQFRVFIWKDEAVPVEAGKLEKGK
jgi:hypothetical protein